MNTILKLCSEIPQKGSGIELSSAHFSLSQGEHHNFMFSCDLWLHWEHLQFICFHLSVGACSMQALDTVIWLLTDILAIPKIFFNGSFVSIFFSWGFNSCVSYCLQFGVAPSPRNVLYRFRIWYVYSFNMPPTSWHPCF